MEPMNVNGQTNSCAPARKFVKVVGILMIIFGGIGMLVSLLAVAAASAAAYLLGASIYIPVIVAVAGSGLQLATGIMAVKYSNTPVKAKTLLILSIVMIGINLLAQILSATMLYGEFNLLNTLLGCLMPVLLIIGANKNMKA